MEIKANGACNWETADTTGINTVQLHILKWIVCVCDLNIHKTIQEVENFA